MDRLSRRSFLSLSSIASVVFLAPSLMRFLKADSLNSNPFQLGVASGAPSTDGFVLWTRLIFDEMSTPDESIAVNWFVSDLETNEIIQSGVAPAISELAFSVHVDISGLESNRWYGYHFSVAGFVSVNGRARTMPLMTDSVESLHLAYASCQRYEDGFYVAYKDMVKQPLDLICFVGDYIYEYASRKDSLRGTGLKKVKSLDEYRARYELYKKDQNLQAAHAYCPWLIVWDDHEVKNNYYYLKSDKGYNDFIELKAAAYQAFYEHMPLSPKSLLEGVKGLKKGRLQIYQSIEFGRLAKIYLLDNRQYRDAPLCTVRAGSSLINVCDSLSADSNSMLGQEQESWLEKSLKNSKSLHSWHLLVQQTRFSPSNYRAGLGNKSSSDTWDGYPLARQRLVDILSENVVGRAVLIGGDIHQNWVANIHHNPYDVSSDVVAAEFTGTSISSQSKATLKSIARSLQKNPHLLFADGTFRGYGYMKIYSDRVEVQLRAVKNISLPESDVFDLASFEYKKNNLVKL